jgi:hypothetical protein
MYNPHDWYWINGDGRIYASKRQIIVDASDPEFISAGAATTPWPRDSEGDQTDAALQGVLAPYSLFVNLEYYTADVRNKKSNGGVVVNGLPFASDPVTMMSLNAAYIYTIDKQTNAFSWKLPDGTFITLDTAGVKDLQSCVAGFGQSCYTCEDEVLTGIEGGTITDRTQVDAAFAAVSNVFTGLAVTTATRHERRKVGDGHR